MKSTGETPIPNEPPKPEAPAPAGSPARDASAAMPDLARWIRPGDVVVCGQAAAEPLGLTQALTAQRHRFPGARVFLGAMFSRSFAPAHADALEFTGYGAMGRAAALFDADGGTIVPIHYRELEAAFASGRLHADVVLMQLPDGGDGAPADNLGLANDYVAQAALRARAVIAEVNPDVPWTFGARPPEGLRIDHVVAATTGLIEQPILPPTEIEQRIAAHIAAIVPDRATIQTGIGRLPDTVLSALAGHRGLGLHSGLLSDGAIALIEAGAATNEHKGIDTGLSITNILGGSRRTHRHFDRNRACRLRPAAYTHSIAVHARLNSLHAINSVIEVDLAGQANSEFDAGRWRGGIGGLADFVRGARLSPGGRSILMLASTTPDGTRSRIVPTLAGARATIPASDADWVVTEWGAAELRDCEARERARRLIAIAHPDHRESLIKMVKMGSDTINCVNRV
ncbi:MAG: acetyl-CoA hydrolase/transferase C-terminal domain-containing protein [Burkholderiaceae bacterium]